MFSYIVAIICVVLMIFSLMLIFLGLPGNWVIILIAAGWAFFTDTGAFGWQFFASIAGLAVVGEIVEFAAGHFGAKKYGGTNKGSMGGMIGAVIGAFLCVPILFGFGALLGALAGGYTGCFVVEKLAGASVAQASHAAFGATLGRFGGFIVKLGIGIALIALCAPRIWPGM